MMQNLDRTIPMGLEPAGLTQRKPSSPMDPVVVLCWYLPSSETTLWCLLKTEKGRYGVFGKVPCPPPVQSRVICKPHKPGCRVVSRGDNLERYPLTILNIRPVGGEGGLRGWRAL